MDPDMNKYDLNHVVTAHPRMSRDDWERSYAQAWRSYYTLDHIETVMRRSAVLNIPLRRIVVMMLWFHGCITLEKVHPLEGGYVRLKFRRDRRPDLPRERPWIFYPRYAAEMVAKHVKYARLVWRLSRLRRRIESDPACATYTDVALTPAADEDFANLAIFTGSDAARAVVERKRKTDSRRLAAAAALARG
jgi:hypothetical protein